MAAWLRTVSFEGTAGGAQRSYWETAWAEEKQGAPPWLLRALEPLVADRRCVLEAGCGQGEFVRLLAGPGRDVVGVDLAARALAASRREHPELALAVADVGRLPFAPGTFDAIVSLGVIEHFEGGPGAVLAAHREVLAPGGTLVLTVPFRSWSRAATDWWHLAVRRRPSYRQRQRVISRRRDASDASTPTFHQYELSQAQLRRWLADAGFSVVSWSAHDAGTAITETALMARLLGRSGPAPTATEATDAPTVGAPGPTRGGPGGALRAMAFGPEPARGIVGRAVRSAVTRTFGHVQLAVAVSAPAPPPVSSRPGRA